MLKIEAGKYYKARNGKKVGPVHLNDSWCDHLFTAEGYEPKQWYSNGKCSTSRQSPDDLIAEWTDGPVVTETVTKTRIVPGVYDGLIVRDVVIIPDCDNPDAPEERFVCLDLAHNTWGADQLDAAAAVLSALAKGLRDA